MLEDYTTAPIGEPLRAMLRFLARMTVAPAELDAADAAAVLAAGVTEAAFVDAVHVSALFNMIDRIADTLGFDIPPPEGFVDGAKQLLKHGYKM